jgi:MFS family permease
MLTGMTVTAIRLGRSYWDLWWAGLASTTGNGAFNAALPLLAVTITRDPRLLSVVTAATFLPWLLVSLPAGALVDRRDRAALMWRAQAAQGVVLAVVTALVLARRADIALLATAGFLLGSAEVVFSNASQAILPQIVDAGLLTRANGTQYAAQTVGEQFLGPPAGSLLFAVSAALPFGLNAAGLAASALLLARLPRVKTATGTAQRLSTQIGEGLGWLVRHRLLRVVALMLGVANFCSQAGQAVLVLFATQTLHVSVRGYGALLAAAAIGSVIGGLVNPWVTRRLGLVTSLLFAMASLAASLAALGLAPNYLVLAGLMTVEGFFVTMWNVVTVTLRQTIVPAELLGRVTSMYRMLGWGLMPLGALAGGFVAHFGGLRAPYLAGGALTAAVLLAVTPALIRNARPAAS